MESTKSKQVLRILLSSLLLSFLISHSFPQITSTPQNLTQKRQLKPYQPALQTFPWEKCADAAFESLRFALNNLWITQAYFTRIRINGISAVGGPGTLKGPKMHSFLKARMIAGKVPPRIADLLGKGILKAWNQWQSSVTVPGLPWYPTFVSFAGPTAPPTPNVPTPLIAATSSRASSLTHSSKLARLILNVLGKEGKSILARRAIKKLAEKISLRFIQWISKIQITGVLGTGPVPTFAPPYVPAGPVTGGWVLEKPPVFSPVKF